MSNRVTDRIADQFSESLHNQAGRIMPGPSLADAARRQAHRIRRNRRIGTAAAACVAVLAIAVPFGLLGANESPRKTENVPIEQPAPTGPPQQSTYPKDAIRLRLGQLPEGAPPDVPYYTASDHAIHDGEQTVPIGHLTLTINDERRTLESLGNGPVVLFVPTPNGYLVRANCCEGIGVGDDRAWLLDTSGDVRLTLPQGSHPILSPDDQRIAAAAYEDNQFERGRLIVFDAATGEELHRSDITDGTGPVPVGFLGDRVLFGDSPSGGTWTALWDPDTDRMPRQEGNPTPDTPDGQRWVTRSSPSLDFLHEISDPSSDRRLRIRGPVSVDHPVQEGDEVLFVASTEDRQALVRCTLDGDCERASGIEAGAVGAPGLSLPSRDRSF